MRFQTMAALAGAAAMTLAGALPACDARAATLDATSAIEAVTVYPDGAAVTRVLRIDLPQGESSIVAGDFPMALDPASLRVAGEGPAGLAIGAIEAEAPRPGTETPQPELEAQLQGLRDQRVVLDDSIAAATLRKRFVERFAATVPFALGEKAQARPIGEWRDAFAAVADEVAQADAAIREARLAQRGLDREIARIEDLLKVAPPRRMQVRIGLAAREAGPVTLRVVYAVRGARWTALYDARLESDGTGGKASLELIRRAEIVQQTGEDWDNVDLTVSTVRTLRGGSAPDLTPLIVRLQPERPAVRSGRDGAATSTRPAPAAAPVPAAARERAQEKEATVEAGAYQVVFRVPGKASIASREGATALRLATARVEPDLLVRAAPAADPRAYLEASFRHAEEAPLLPGRVALYRDGVFVGRSLLRTTAREETVRLGFGADERVAVTRTAIRRNEGTAGIITSSRTDEREFRISVRNGHRQPVRLRIEDRLPVSEVEDVTVELLSLTTSPSETDVAGRRGVVAWVFEAAAGESRDIRIGWRLRWPAERQILYSAATP